MKNKKLALFFTFNVSVKIWKEKGLLYREKEIYEKYISEKIFSEIYWFTYGCMDGRYSKELADGINIISMPKFFDFYLGRILYSLLMPFIHRNIFKKVDYLKTNQISGSWSGVLCKFFYRKPLIVRTGYTLSLFVINSNISKLKKLLKYLIIRMIEYFAYKFSDAVVVSSEADKDYIIKKYSLHLEKVNVIPNYIDTKKFYNIRDIKKYKNRIIYVGRLTHQKNLFSLIEAITKTKLILDIYGKGESEKKLKLFAKMQKAKVNFLGVVPNDLISEKLNKYKYFILPSYYEGMPKSLLEAMACGLICIGTNVKGINEVIVDNVNGYLIDNTLSTEIAKKLNLIVLRNSEQIVKNAVETIKIKYSIDIIFYKYIRLFEKIDKCVKYKYRAYKWKK